eukprot:PhM_4_TR16663/c0_g1_i1/m.23757/K00762/pyrE; orotate phosphoribosyltransferase
MSDSAVVGRNFVEFALSRNVLKFGEFTLKSGRVSPYFFNAGHFNTGAMLATLGNLYADTVAIAIQNKAVEVDVLFGPAYKGIPLVAITAMALAQRHNIDLPYAFNRKEAKDHGEGGSLVGYTDLKGKRVLVLDDVITAGSAIRESKALLDGLGATIAGVVVALDRQEKGLQSDKSAVQEVQQEFGVPVLSVASMAVIIDYLSQGASGDADAATNLEKMKAYREQYGV